MIHDPHLHHDPHLQLFRRQMLILRHYFSDHLVRPVHEALSAAAVNFVFENRLKVGWEDVHDGDKHNNQKCYHKIKSKHLNLKGRGRIAVIGLQRQKLSKSSDQRQAHCVQVIIGYLFHSVILMSNRKWSLRENRTLHRSLRASHKLTKVDFNQAQKLTKKKHLSTVTYFR